MYPYVSNEDLETAKTRAVNATRLWADELVETLTNISNQLATNPTNTVWAFITQEDASATHSHLEELRFYYTTEHGEKHGSSITRNNFNQNPIGEQYWGNLVTIWDDLLEISAKDGHFDIYGGNYIFDVNQRIFATWPRKLCPIHSNPVPRVITRIHGHENLHHTLQLLPDITNHQEPQLLLGLGETFRNYQIPIPTIPAIDLECCTG